MASFLSRNKTVVLDFSLFLASSAAMLYAVKWVLEGHPPSLWPQKRTLKPKQLSALEKMTSSSSATLSNLNDLSEHELAISAALIHPSDIHTTFADIGGLDHIISSLRESVIYPLLYPNLFASSAIAAAPKGVLLYGPPGCGKTLLAKAVAKESGAAFLNVSPSLITSKWFGESNKLVHALFSLARRIQPCIIFVDEIDCFLRERDSGKPGGGGGEHEAMGMVKSEFMTLWDGLLTPSSSSGADRILILGATNRPHSIDPAILRRMPKRYQVPLPSSSQRRNILELMLRDVKLADDVHFDELAKDGGVMDGLSGSAIREVCRNAALQPIREHLRTLPSPISSVQPPSLGDEVVLRKVGMRDFIVGEEEYENSGQVDGLDGPVLD